MEVGSSSSKGLMEESLAGEGMRSWRTGEGDVEVGGGSKLEVVDTSMGVEGGSVTGESNEEIERGTMAGVEGGESLAGKGPESLTKVAGESMEGATDFIRGVVESSAEARRGSVGEGGALCRGVEDNSFSRLPSTTPLHPGRRGCPGAGRRSVRCGPPAAA